MICCRYGVGTTWCNQNSQGGRDLQDTNKIWLPEFLKSFMPAPSRLWLESMSAQSLADRIGTALQFVLQSCTKHRERLWANLDASGEYRRVAKTLGCKFTRHVSPRNGNITCSSSREQLPYLLVQRHNWNLTYTTPPTLPQLFVVHADLDELLCTSKLPGILSILTSTHHASEK